MSSQNLLRCQLIYKVLYSCLQPKLSNALLHSTALFFFCKHAFTQVKKIVKCFWNTFILCWVYYKYIYIFMCLWHSFLIKMSMDMFMLRSSVGSFTLSFNSWKFQLSRSVLFATLHVFCVKCFSICDMSHINTSYMTFPFNKREE